MPRIDPSPGEVRAKVLAAVAKSSKPLPVTALVKQVKCKKEQVEEALREAAGAGEIFRWPDYRKSQCFWNLSPDKKARESILEAAGRVALGETALREAAARQLPGLRAEDMKPLIAALLAEKQLRKVPAFGSSSKLLLKVGSDEAYFESAKSFLEEKFRKAGIDGRGFWRAAAEENTSQKTALNVASLILEAIRRLEPIRGVPVSTVRLRAEMPEVPKRDFDAAALELRERQDVFLSLHTDAFNLPPEDRNELIDGQNGTYYVAVSLR